MIVDRFIKRIPEEHDITEEVASDDTLFINNNKVMSRINWTTIKSNLVMGFLFGLLGVLLYIKQAGTVFGLDVHSIIDIFALAFVGVIISFLQSLLTSPETGKFAGAVKIK